MAEATESKSGDALAGKTPEPAPKAAPDESGEEALDGFVKDAGSWFEEEVLAAKLDKEKEAEEAQHKAEQAARDAEAAKVKSEKELKAKLDAEVKAREKAEADAKASADKAKKAEKSAAKKKEMVAASAPAAAAAPQPAASSKNGLYFLIGAVILGGALVIAAMMIMNKDKGDKSGAASGGSMAADMAGDMAGDMAPTDPVPPAMTEPAMTEPIRTEPVPPAPDTPKIGGLQCVDKKVWIGRFQVGPAELVSAAKPLYAKCGTAVCRARGCFAKDPQDPAKTVLSAEVIEPADVAASYAFAQTKCQRDDSAGTVFCEFRVDDKSPWHRFDSRPGATQPAMTEPAMTEPAMTEPAMTEPAMTEPAMQPAMRPGMRRVVRPGMRPVMRRTMRRPMRRRPGMRRRGMWDNPFG